MVLGVVTAGVGVAGVAATGGKKAARKMNQIGTDVYDGMIENHQEKINKKINKVAHIKSSIADSLSYSLLSSRSHNAGFEDGGNFSVETNAMNPSIQLGPKGSLNITPKELQKGLNKLLPQGYAVSIDRSRGYITYAFTSVPTTSKVDIKSVQKPRRLGQMNPSLRQFLVNNTEKVIQQEKKKAIVAAHIGKLLNYEAITSIKVSEAPSLVQVKEIVDIVTQDEVSNVAKSQAIWQLLQKLTDTQSPEEAKRYLLSSDVSREERMYFNKVYTKKTFIGDRVGGTLAQELLTESAMIEENQESEPDAIKSNLIAAGEKVDQAIKDQLKKYHKKGDYLGAKKHLATLLIGQDIDLASYTAYEKALDIIIGEERKQGVVAA